MGLCLNMATTAAGLLRSVPSIGRVLGGARGLQTNAPKLGAHHWYPDKEYMKQYEGNVCFGTKSSLAGSLVESLVLTIPFTSLRRNMIHNVPRQLVDSNCLRSL